MGYFFSSSTLPTQETRRSGWEFLRSALRCNTGTRPRERRGRERLCRGTWARSCRRPQRLPGTPPQKSAGEIALGKRRRVNAFIKGVCAKFKKKYRVFFCLCSWPGCGAPMGGGGGGGCAGTARLLPPLFPRRGARSRMAGSCSRPAASPRPPVPRRMGMGMGEGTVAEGPPSV